MDRDIYLCFGFSENPTIELQICEALSLYLEKKLCWTMINDVSISLLLKRKKRTKIDSNYTKHIYLYDPIKTSTKGFNTQSIMQSKITSNIWEFYTTTLPSFIVNSTFTTREINYIKTTTAINSYNETKTTNIQTTTLPSFIVNSTFTKNQCYSFLNFTLNPLSNCNQINDYCSYNQQVYIIN